MPGRSGFLTVRDRKTILPGLPSLRQPLPPEADEAAEFSVPTAAPAAAPESAEPSSYLDRGLPLPSHYGMDRLVALPRDAGVLFVYWELRGGRLESFLHTLDEALVRHGRWVLRLEARFRRAVQLIQVDLYAGQWYLRVLPAEWYRIALGLQTLEGDFLELCHGPQFQTPPYAVSQVVDEAWRTDREDLVRLLQASGVPLPAAQAPSAGRREESQGPCPWPRARTFFSGTHLTPGRWR